MNAHQMVCHLNDSFRAGTGEAFASPASNLFSRTVMKWVALRTPMKWPPGVPTRPEMEQGKGGTPPSEWARDCGALREMIVSFAERAGCAREHPIFGRMTREEWNIWGWRHVDHHFRQFGV
jgi:hypothetical protein